MAHKNKNISFGAHCINEYLTVAPTRHNALPRQAAHFPPPKTHVRTPNTQITFVKFSLRFLAQSVYLTNFEGIQQNDSIIHFKLKSYENLPLKTN